MKYRFFSVPTEWPDAAAEELNAFLVCILSAFRGGKKQMAAGMQVGGADASRTLAGWPVFQGSIGELS
jgi:hypothetical protein